MHESDIVAGRPCHAAAIECSRRAADFRTSARAIRPMAGICCGHRSTSGAHSTIRAASRCSTAAAGAHAARAEAGPRRRARRRGRRTARRCSCSSRIAGGKALYRLGLDAAMRRRPSRPAARSCGFDVSRGRRAHRLRTRHAVAAAGAVCHATPMAAASARWSRRTRRCWRRMRSARRASSRSRAGAANRCRSGSRIRRISIREEVAAAALDPRRPARGAHATAGTCRWNTQVFAAQGYVVVGVNYHGSIGLRPEVHRVDHGQLRREGIRRHRGGDRLHAAPGLHRSRRGWSRQAAATAATWSRT